MSGLLLGSSVFAANTPTAAAMPSIMAVDFELRDFSPIPNTPQEVERTALIGTTIKQALAENGYQMMAPCDQLKQAAEQGRSYLYDRPELAGKIGGECGAVTC